jgi:lauroyl/myristoyl acyltransferase
MASSSILNSKLSVQLSILIGRYLPKRLSYGFSQSFGSFLAARKNLEVTRAIRSNQYIANGMVNSQEELVEKTRMVLTHAGKCYVDLYQVYAKPELLDSLVPLTQPMREFIDLSHEKQGYMVVAPHLSNFDLVVCSLVKYGFKGKVLSYSNPGSGYRLQNKIRESFGMEIVPLGNPELEVEIINHLKNGGVAATGVDRPVSGKKKHHYVNFFGRPSPLPVGYITTALAADVPIIVVTAIMESDGTYGFRYTDPIELTRSRSRLDDIKINTERILRRVEDFIKLAPEQWLMYYQVWPDVVSEGR